jgi:hypothetical protein
MKNLKTKTELILDGLTTCEHPKVVLIAFSVIVIVSAIIAVIYPLV